MNQLIAALLLSPTATAPGAIGPVDLAQQPLRPLQKLGSCPLGWFSSGDYGVKNR